MTPNATLDRHTESTKEAVRQAKRLAGWEHSDGVGRLTEDLAYDHARAAARIVLDAQKADMSGGRWKDGRPMTPAKGIPVEGCESRQDPYAFAALTSPDPTLRTLLNAARRAREAKFFLDDLAKTLPAGTTLEVVASARRRLHIAETDLADEADALARYAGLER